MFETDRGETDWDMPYQGLSVISCCVGEQNFLCEKLMTISGQLREDKRDPGPSERAYWAFSEKSLFGI